MRRAGSWLKLIFSVGMLAYILYISNPHQILPALYKANFGLLMAGVGLWILIQLMNVYKWWLLNRAQGISLPYKQLLDVYFIGMFFNSFLPSGFGGDAMRAYEMSRLTRQGGTSTVSVIIDRFTSLYALVLMATVALLFAPEELRVIPFPWLLGLDLLGALGFYALLQGSWIRQILKLPMVASRTRISRFLEEIASSTVSLRASTRTLFMSLGISLGFQFLSAVEHHFFIKALGIQTPFSSTALFFPILTIVSSLPVTINGLGLREGGYVYFLGLLGVARGDAVLVGLISFSMLLLSGMWGAIVYMGSRRESPQPLEGRNG